MAESNTVDSYFLNAADRCILTRSGFLVSSAQPGPCWAWDHLPGVKMEEGQSLLFLCLLSPPSIERARPPGWGVLEGGLAWDSEP